MFKILYMVHDVRLQVENHFYYDIKDGRRFPSVTSSLLKMVLPEFNGEEVKQNIFKSYENFNSWYNLFSNPNPKEYLEIVSLYYNYKNYRKFVITQGYNGTYKKYKKITDYSTKEELIKDLKLAKYNNPNIQKSKVYVWGMYKPMSVDDISEFWQQLTVIANIFGTMVHEICEEWFCKHYKNDFYEIADLQLAINSGWSKLKKCVNENIRKYPVNKWCFEQYIIPMELKEFKKHIISSFLALKPDLGIGCISEKVLGSRKYNVFGTIDTLIDISNIHFDINDHKTNKVFTVENDETFLTPYDNYDNCDKNKFKFQTNTYAKLHNLATGKDCRKIWISYFNREKYAFERIEIGYDPNLGLELLEMHEQHIIKLRNKWRNYSPIKQVDRRHRVHLITLLHKKVSEYKLQGLGSGLIDKKLRKFINEDYVKWKNN